MGKKELKKTISSSQTVTAVETAQMETTVLEKESIKEILPQIKPEKQEKETYNMREFDIRTLLDYEEAAKFACRKYENMIKCHDGSINYNLPNGAAFKKYNMIHSQILEEICVRLNNLVF